MVFLSEYSKTHGLPAGYISFAIGRAPSWSLLERGLAELTTEFYEKFTQEILAPSSWADYHRPREAPGLPPSATAVSSKEIIKGILRATNRPDAGMARAIAKLKSSGIKLAVITNDIQVPVELAEECGIPKNDWTKLRELFDVWISSSTLHIRKPDPRIYQAALDSVGVAAQKAIFLDDIGSNLKSAAGLGIKTIRVEIGKVREALREVEGLLNVELLEEFEGGRKARL